MNQIKLSPHQHEGTIGHGVHHTHAPYWKRAHRSVFFWVAVLLMLAAIGIYLMSDDLSGWTRN